MKTFKVGDKVRLDESTKPYTYKLGDSVAVITSELRDDVHIISSILKDGDVLIQNILGDERSVQSKHLTHIEEEVNQLRLDIFRTNPSLSVLEMQDIENWLLNK